MHGMKAPAILIPLALITFFSYGCTATQRAQLMSEAKDYIVEELRNATPKIIAAATEAAEKKLNAAEEAKLKELDHQLEAFATIDPETGIATKKTWKDFDIDRSSNLDSFELAKVAAFVTTQTAKKVASGEMSKDEAGKTAKQTGVTLAALMAILLGKRAVDKARGKSGSPAPPGPPPQPPVAPIA